MYSLRVEPLVVGHFKERQQHVAASLSCARWTGYTKVITTTGNIDVQAAFYLSQVFIKLAAKIGQATIVGGLEDYVPRYLDSIQST